MKRVLLPARTRFSRRLVLAVLAVVCPLAFASVAEAATFTVNDTRDAALKPPGGTSCISTDAGRCTLRAAVEAADNAGGTDTIDLPAGTIKLTIPSKGQDDPATGDLDLDANVIVRGVGPGRTIIDAGHIDRVFSVQSPATSLSVQDLTIENGDASASKPSSNGNSDDPGQGGAILAYGPLSVIDSSLVDDVAQGEGGAIFAAGPTTTITGSTISHDTTTSGPGGALMLTGTNVTVSGSTLSHDTAGSGPGGAIYLLATGTEKLSGNTMDDDRGLDGGAIAQGAGTLSITGSTFADNTLSAPTEGGALYLDNTSTSQPATVSGSTFSGNSGAAQGGAVYATADSKMTFSRDLFTANAASGTGGTGGALYATGTSTLRLVDSTLSSNSALDGGGIYVNSGDPVIGADTLAGDSATRDGGGIYLDGGAAALASDTIAHNTAGYGAGIYNPSQAGSVENTLIAGNTIGGDCYDNAPFGTTADHGHNLDSDGSCFGGATPTTPEVSTDRVHVNSRIGSLASNGGPLQTIALLPGSPAIGAGISGLDGLTTDERGIKLPAGRPDIGAFQTAAADVGLTAPRSGRLKQGKRLKLTFKFSNHGPGPASAASFSLHLPSRLRFVSVHSTIGHCSGRTTVKCSLGMLGSSEVGGKTSGSITLTVLAKHRGTVRLNAAISSSTTDPKSSNNRTTTKVTILR